MLDKNSMDMLEFPRIREILAGYTSFSTSRDLAVKLEPSNDPVTVSLWLQQSAEARRLLSLKPEFSIGNAHDIREAIKVASKGKVLGTEMFLDIRDTLASVRVVRNNLKKLAEQVPALWDIAVRMAEYPEIEKEIERCITPAGEIAESASPRLAALRRQLRESRQRILDKLNAMVKSKHYEGFFQEPIVTEREGRYVVPVKSEYRKDVKGIVHDVSNTAATLFVEPFSVVEAGNDLRKSVIEERQEIERILGNLSATVGSKESGIRWNIELLAEIDLAVAKARYAEKARAVEPAIVVPFNNEDVQEKPNDNILRLVNARHPLLKGKAVPLNVEIGSDFTILIITGPNTGGKTVALKTVGLLTLMTQAGMPIPAAEGSSIPVFDNVFADIGDQQSIEHTLSTFSWHIGNIISIIQQSTRNSLILLDELGISTDPAEGAALARAILLHFLEQGVMAVATTHYADLKVFAHTTQGLQNGSMDFDPVTLLPTYHLTIGVPGGSNALSIASRLGLSEKIISVAQQLTEEGSLKMDELLASLVMEREKFKWLNDGLEEEKQELHSARTRLESEMQKMVEDERMLLRNTKEDLLEDAATLQKMIHEVETELRKTRKKEAVERGKAALHTMNESLSGEKWQTRGGRAADDAAELLRQPVPGDTVRFIDRNLEGIVVSSEDGGKQLDIQIGNTRVTVNASEVEKTDTIEAGAVPAGPVISKTLDSLPASREIDLRGKRAHEVSNQLDRFLNDAFLAHFKEVRIVHGYATGTVRKIVREILSGHPLVKSFRPGGKDEGGDGVTVVQL